MTEFLNEARDRLAECRLYFKEGWNECLAEVLRRVGEFDSPADDAGKEIFCRLIDEEKIKPGEYLAFKMGMKEQHAAILKRLGLG